MSRIPRAWIVLCLATASSFAEDFSWPTVVARALRQNPALRAADARVEAARRNRQGALGYFLPELSAQAEYARTPGTETYSLGLTGSQNLFRGWRDRARLESATWTVEAASQSSRAARATLGYELASAFSSLVYAQDAVLLQREILRRRDENLSVVELRFEGGRENKGSVLLFRAYVEQAKLDEWVASNQIASSRAALSRSMGENLADDIRAVGAITVIDPPSSVDFPSLANATPGVLRLSAEREAAKTDVIAARGAFYPTLSFSGSTGLQDDAFVPTDDFWRWSATLDLPFFSGGRDYRAIQSARALWIAAAAEAENERRDALAALVRTYNAFQEAQRRVRVDTAFLEAVRVRSDIARHRYNNGLMSFEDWDVIENDLINRQRSLLASVRDRAIAQAAWMQAKGESPSPEEHP